MDQDSECPSHPWLQEYRGLVKQKENKKTCQMTRDFFQDCKEWTHWAIKSIFVLVLTCIPSEDNEGVLDKRHASTVSKEQHSVIISHSYKNLILWTNGCNIPAVHFLKSSSCMAKFFHFALFLQQKRIFISMPFNWIQQWTIFHLWNLQFNQCMVFLFFSDTFPRLPEIAKRWQNCHCGQWDVSKSRDCFGECQLAEAFWLDCCQNMAKRQSILKMLRNLPKIKQVALFNCDGEIYRKRRSFDFNKN